MSAIGKAMKGSKSPAKTKSKKTGSMRKSNPRANYERLKNRIAKASAQYKEGVNETIHTVELHGALAASAFAAGYFGPSKLRLFNSPLGDARVLGGGALLVYGLMQAFDGSMSKTGMAGNHVLALGNGVLGSVVYEMAHNAGVDLATKQGKATAAPAGTRSKIAGARPVLVSGSQEGDYGTVPQMGGRLRTRAAA